MTVQICGVICTRTTGRSGVDVPYCRLYMPGVVPTDGDQFYIELKTQEGERML